MNNLVNIAIQTQQKNLASPAVFTLEQTGDGSGIATIRFESSADVDITLSNSQVFYSDSGATIPIGATWTVTSGALRTAYIKLSVASCTMTIADATLITGWGTSESDGWVSSTNAPKISGNLEAFTNLTQLMIYGNSTLTGDIATLSSTNTIRIHYANRTTYSTRAWSVVLAFIVVAESGYGWSVADISQCLIDLSSATWGGVKRVGLASPHSSMADTNQGGIWGDFNEGDSPSALATALKVLVKGKNVTISLNGITLPGETGDGSGFPAGFGDWWRS
jgi:hypothetical protein